MSELNEQTDIGEQKAGRTQKRYRANPVLLILLAACVLFSGFQTIYIIALTTGRVGIFSYNRSSETEQTERSGGRETEPSRNIYADPAFSLEEAASVTDPDKETLSTMEIVRRVSPATVSVYLLGDAYGNESVLSSGSGFIITHDGYIVTNAHVVENAVDNPDYRIEIHVPGYADNIPAAVVGTDAQTDIAVLKLTEGDGYECVTLGDSDQLQQGELVVVIGNPLGTLEGTVTAGIVSALDRQINNHGYRMTLIQTDASINSGNSGGPLINSFGEVVGITNAKIGSAEGLGFAIPISEVRNVIESLASYGYVAGRPYLGVTVSYVSSNSYYGAVEGVYAVEIDPGSPSDEAGIEVGDRIVSLDGVEISATSDIISVRDSHEIGDTIEVIVDRDGQRIALQLTIGDSRPSDESTEELTDN